MEEDIYEIERAVFDALVGKLGSIPDEKERNSYIENTIKSIYPAASKEVIQQIIKDSSTFSPVDNYISDPKIEDIMINNTSNIFVYQSGTGQKKINEKVQSRKELDLLVKKFKMYATTNIAGSNIFDVHLPSGSRVNIVNSPLGADITIRNFRRQPLSMIDLINLNELNYNIAARLWLYTDGLKVRPANLLIGGMPASGKTTLLNAMFGFLRPEARVVVIEETYELNTEMQENCVRLETSTDVSMEDLVKNALRMRPDMIIIGEVRGEEAKDMMTAMNIGKISMGTIHASTARDIITRLEHTPMNIERDIIPLIDSLIVLNMVPEGNASIRKITQIAEISGVESQVLLSDLYSYDYKTRKGSQLLPSVTYRDTLAKLTGLPPSEIIIEEQRRAKVLERLNQLGIRGMKEINEFCKSYYDDPAAAMKKLGLEQLGYLQY